VKIRGLYYDLFAYICQIAGEIADYTLYAYYPDEFGYKGYQISPWGKT
jgi:hypothetical protein